MSEMIERVAKAIDPEGWAYHEIYLRIKEADAEMAKDFTNRSARIQRSLMSARAAIEAMRDPSDDIAWAMNDVAIDGPGYVSFYPSFADCKTLFNAAIDAALSQDTHSLSPLNPPADEEGAAANPGEARP